MRFELKGITAGYGDTFARRDVDLVVSFGTVVALLGSNGAGKATLLRVASGLLRPRAGRSHIDGRDVTGAVPAALARRGIRHITEGRSVFPALTVHENLRLFSAAGRERDGVARAVEAFPKLGERMKQGAGTMSGGEHQMLALARAYIPHAPVVLLDEVSMGLAPIVVDAIFGFLDNTGGRRLEPAARGAVRGEGAGHGRQTSTSCPAAASSIGEANEVDSSELAAQYPGAEVA